MRARFLAPVALIGLCCAGCAAAPQTSAPPPDEDAAVDAPWGELRSRPPPLTRRDASPDPAQSFALPMDPGVVMERLQYRSGELDLFAVIARPRLGPLTPATPTQPMPGVVLFHGGFVLAPDQLDWARAVARRGFVVMMPSLRGENGNPGHFELLRGEVEDARAAARFLAAEPDVDIDRLYAFGHSAGGGLATLLAVDGDVPFRLLASSNGVYAPSTFVRWKKENPALVPFDVADLRERQVRALVPFAAQIKLPLTLYIGTEDEWPRRHAARALKAATAAGAPLTVVEVPGDHMGALPHALAKFIEQIEKDAFGAAPPAAAQPVALRVR